MEFTFRLCPDDLIALEKQYKRANLLVDILFITIIGTVILGPFLFFVAVHVLKTPNIQSNVAANGVAGLKVFAPFAVPVLLFYLLWFVAPIFKKKMMRGSPVLQNEVRLRVDKNGISAMDRMMPWDTIQRIIPTKDHLFVVDNKNTAFIVPLRIFNSEFEVQDFTAKVQDYWKSAKDDTNTNLITNR